MNDQNQNPSPNSNTPPPSYRDSREQRYAERLARREARRQRYGSAHYGWFGGALLILLGVIFLLENMGIPFLVNWWALFILIPACGAYLAAWEVYQDQGRLTRSGAWSLTVGILLTAVSLFFLLNLSIGPYWPVLLIAGGLALLGAAWLPE
ncbi:MAG TPA: hypothetical protein VLZ89_10360 [Anaerolineales bacterium]|nr:hypothetical protein [Anaerolineales bacterium]